MPSFGSRFAEAALWLLLKPPSCAEAGARAVHAAALRPSPYGPPRRLRRDVSVDYAIVHGWTVYTVAPVSRRSNKVLVYVHGGAFYGEITAFHWRLIARIAAESETVVKVPIYPLVPRGTAANVVETITSITADEVERAGPGAVSLGGDSAGGNIALAVALQLSQLDIQLRCTLLIHPAVDLSMSNPEIAIVERKDPILRAAALRPILDCWKGDLDIRDPRVSPLYGTLAGLGPLTIFSGTHDATNPDTRLLVTKANGVGVHVTYYEGEGLTHVSPALPTREGREVRREIIDALK